MRASSVPTDRANTTQVRPRSSWAGYAACLWALVFAAISFYWALGGRLGVGTIGAAVETPALAREPGFVALLWATAVLKVLGAVLALALAGRAFCWLPRGMVRSVGWLVAVLLLGYGLASLMQHLLMADGRAEVPEELGRDALPWHLWLWDPVWIVGGLLFALAAIQYSAAGRRYR